MIVQAVNYGNTGTCTMVNVMTTTQGQRKQFRVGQANFSGNFIGVIIGMCIAQISRGVWGMPPQEILKK